MTGVEHPKKNLSLQKWLSTSSQSIKDLMKRVIQKRHLLQPLLLLSCETYQTQPKTLPPGGINQVVSLHYTNVYRKYQSNNVQKVSCCIHSQLVLPSRRSPHSDNYCKSIIRLTARICSTLPNMYTNGKPKLFNKRIPN